MHVYLINAGYDGCAYVRCLLPQIYNGWWGSMSSIRGSRESNEQMYQGAMQADIVVFQRPMQIEMFEAAKLLKEAGKKIVFDNDDTYDPKSGVPKMMTEILDRQIDNKIGEINDRLREFARMADLVTVSTEFLAKEYRGVNENVVVLPNMVDPDDWDTPKRTKGKQVRIGLVGSTVMNSDASILTPILRQLGKRDEIQLVIFGIPSRSEEKIRAFYKHEIAYWNTMNVEWHPSVNIQDYFTTLNDLELDIMLIPRTDSYFNRAKSNVKFLEASMLEIPVIAQGFTTGDSPYQGKDAPYMRIAVTEEDWSTHIEALVADKKLRRKIGKDAKKYVLKNYNINDTAHLWNEAYQTII